MLDSEFIEVKTETLKTPWQRHDSYESGSDSDSDSSSDGDRRRRKLKSAIITKKVVPRSPSRSPSSSEDSDRSSARRTKRRRSSGECHSTSGNSSSEPGELSPEPAHRGRSASVSDEDEEQRSRRKKFDNERGSDNTGRQVELVKYNRSDAESGADNKHERDNRRRSRNDRSSRHIKAKTSDENRHEKEQNYSSDRSSSVERDSHDHPRSYNGDTQYDRDDQRRISQYRNDRRDSKRYGRYRDSYNDRGRYRQCSDDGVYRGRFRPADDDDNEDDGGHQGQYASRFRPVDDRKKYDDDRDRRRDYDRGRYDDDDRRRDDDDRRYRGRRENGDSRGKRSYEDDDEKENINNSFRKRRHSPEYNSGKGGANKEGDGDPDNMASFLAAKRAKKNDNGSIMTRTGGAYIPPARLRMMQQQIEDKTSAEYQRLSWEALKKSIMGLVNKINVANIAHIVRELFQENIVRGRGWLARCIIQAQASSPTFTHVYAALVAVLNTKFPQNGELILKRLVIQFRKGFKRNDKQLCLTSLRFIAHLVNQQVAHEILALEVLTLLLENPTDDSVEVSIGFLKESGQKLCEVTPKGVHAIFNRLRTILHEGQIEQRTQYMVEVMFAIRKDGFKAHPAVIEDLDLVEEVDQFTHMLTLEDAVSPEDILNVFKVDPEYQENEEKYKVLKRDILEEDSSGSDEDGSGSEGSESSSEEEEEEEGETNKHMIVDTTETNLVALRRTIYLTIHSSLDFEECAHKLLKLEFKPGQETELCNMILDCCAQQRTYEKFFGLLAQRFCMLEKKYVLPFQQMFQEQYNTVHQLETNKLRNVAKFFSHLLYTDAILWEVLRIIRLNEDDTTSSSRIFIKILFQELSEYLGLAKLNDRLKDPTLQPFFEGLMPRDNPRDTRFAINFFTSIGLGGLTDELRAHLKTMPKPAVVKPAETESESSSDSSDSESSSSSDSNSSGSDSSSESSSSESDSDSEDSSSSSSAASPAHQKGSNHKVHRTKKDRQEKANLARQEAEQEHRRRDRGEMERNTERMDKERVATHRRNDRMDEERVGEDRRDGRMDKGRGAEERRRDDRMDKGRGAENRRDDRMGKGRGAENRRDDRMDKGRGVEDRRDEQRDVDSVRDERRQKRAHRLPHDEPREHRHRHDGETQDRRRHREHNRR
ncbi:Pre-mRNA-splicing factor CWC22-like protein [Lamellibrachia satsuma]|nr:Pre-mRNA-splicing factor CWC22-like protein [Lamellibrachia satsuma]